MAGFSTPGLPLAVAPLTGNELIAADTQLTQGLNPESEAISIAQIAGYLTNTPNAAIATPDNGTTQTLTAAMIAVAGVDNVIHVSTGGSTPTLTLPLATAVFTLEGANFVSGSTYILRVINSNSGTATIATATGWTLSGTLTLATTTWREFLVQATSSSTLTATSIGTGTNS